MSQVNDFFAFLNKIKKSLNAEKRESDVEYLTLMEISSNIEDKYNNMFYDSLIAIDGFSQEDDFYSKVSPFKKALSIE